MELSQEELEQVGGGNSFWDPILRGVGEGLVDLFFGGGQRNRGFSFGGSQFGSPYGYQQSRGYDPFYGGGNQGGFNFGFPF
jgi:hypothetical protein